MSGSAAVPVGAVRRPRLARSGRPGVVVAAVVAAVLANLGLYALGSAAGAGYAFTSQGEPAAVGPLTLAAFTAVPLAIGLATAALLMPRWSSVGRVGIVLAPVLGLGSIWAMPLQTDLDAPSRVTLSLTHVMVTAAAVLALLALRSMQAAAPGGLSQP